MKKGQESFVTYYRSKTQETGSDVHTGWLASTPSDSNLVRWGAAGFLLCRTRQLLRRRCRHWELVPASPKAGEPLGKGAPDTERPAVLQGIGAQEPHYNFHHKCPPPQVSPYVCTTGNPFRKVHFYWVHSLETKYSLKSLQKSIQPSILWINNNSFSAIFIENVADSNYHSETQHWKNHLGTK